MLILLMSLALADDPVAPAATDAPAATPAVEPDPEPVPVAPEPAPLPDAADPSELIELARRRILTGDYEGARIALDRAGTLLGADADTAAYLRGVTTELEGDPGGAIGLYDAGLREWPGSRLTPDRLFRKAEALASLGAAAEALVLLDRIPRDGFTAADQHKLALVEGIWLVEAGKPHKGLPVIADALDATGPTEVTFYQAKARATVVGVLGDAAAALTLDTSQKKMVARLKERADLIARMERQATAIAELDEPEWVLQAVLDLGAAYQAVGDDLATSRRPKKLTDDQRAIYDVELAKRVEAMWVKASRAYGLGLDLAERLAWESRRVGELEAARAAVTERLEGG